MKKVIKKKKVVSKVTASNKALEVSEVVASEVKPDNKVERLETAFGNGEVNQVVEKLNEVIKVLNKCQ